MDEAAHRFNFMSITPQSIISSPWQPVQLDETGDDGNRTPRRLRRSKEASASASTSDEAALVLARSGVEVTPVFLEREREQREARAAARAARPRIALADLHTSLHVGAGELLRARLERDRGPDQSATLQRVERGKCTTPTLAELAGWMADQSLTRQDLCTYVNSDSGHPRFASTDR